MSDLTATAAAGSGAAAGSAATSAGTPADQESTLLHGNDTGADGAAEAGDAPETLLHGNDATEPAKADPQYQALRQRVEADQQRAMKALSGQWRKEAEQDAEIGGDNFKANVARAQLALRRFDTNRSVGQWLAQSGYGNHPEVLRFFSRIADALSEDGLVQGGGAGGELPLEERMYGHWSP